MIPVASVVGGLRLRSLEIEQRLKQLSLITVLWSLSTPLSTLLKTSLELLQLEVGSSRFALYLSFSKYAHLVTTC